MNEDLLQYLWRTHQFNHHELMTTEGDIIEVLDFGRLNHNAGPDFLHGKIRIGDTTLAGHIEIHIKSSDWDKHRHQNDPAYNNVILHVVWIHDKDVCTQQGRSLLTMTLNERINNDLLIKFNKLKNAEGQLPCAGLHPEQIGLSIWRIWKERLNIERLQKKVQWVDAQLEDTAFDWQEIFYRQLCKSMGMKVNQAAFEDLAVRLDFRTLIKHREDQHFIEAWIFGTSGLLSINTSESYILALKEQWRFIQEKYQLDEMPNLWRYAKMRPINFPDLRIAQFCAFLKISDNLLSDFMVHPDLIYIKAVLADINIHEYWNNHYRIGAQSKSKPKHLGSMMLDSIVINGVLPSMFFYAYTHHNADLHEKVLLILGQIKPELNHITKQWQQIGIENQNAGDSQALIQLKTNYCDHKRCLHCSIGHQLLKVK